MKRVLSALMFAISIPSYAADATAILNRVDQFRNPLDSFAIDVALTSYEPKKKEETQTFRVYGKGSDRSVVEFTSPATEKGKFLLMLRDAMWIYMPSASRPIRISPLQRLMGQASNGDVARTAFTVDYIAQSVADDENAYVIDLLARDPAIAYSRIRLWVDRQTYEPQRADFYVISGKLIKRAFYRDFGELNGRRVITAVEIEDLLRPGYRTVMRYDNLAKRENPDRMFTKDALGKW